jgi:hypothetical protein
VTEGPLEGIDFDMVEISGRLEKFDAESGRLVETIIIENGEITEIIKEEE